MRARLLTFAALVLFCVSLTLVHWTRADDLPLLGVATSKVTTAAYQGPVDIVASPVACYSMFACSQAIATAGTQPLVQLVNASDTCNFYPASNGSMGTTKAGGCTGSTPALTSVASFCSGGCTVATAYNQVGTANLTQTTARPNFTVSAIGGHPVIATTASTAGLDGNTGLPFTCGTPVAGGTGCIFSTSSVIQRTATGGGVNLWSYQFAGVLLIFANSSNLLAYSSSATITSTVNDNLPHNTQIVFNAAGTTAGTSLYVDGGSAVTVSGGTTRGLLSNEQPAWLEGNNGGTNQCSVCSAGEFVIWNADNTASVAALNSNAHSRWGF